MRTIKLTLERDSLKENEGVQVRVYEASSMGDMTHIGTVEVYDADEKIFQLNERQALEIRPASIYNG